MTDTAEAKTGERTAGPWTIRRSKYPTDGEYDYAIEATIDGEKFVIAEAFGRVATNVRTPAEANAAYIVQACNGFPALVEALELIAGGFEGEGLEVENQWRKEVARSALEAAMKSEGR